MTLITILAVLALERFVHLGQSLFRFNWFENYLGLMRKIFEKSGILKGPQGLVLLLLPILLAVFIIYYLFAGMVFGLIGFILAILILIYCLGPRDLHQDFESYFTAVKGEDDAAVKKSLAHIMKITPSDKKEISRSVTKAVFTQFNQRIFAVLFWFVVLGPVAAVFYRIVVIIKESVEKSGSSETSMLLWATHFMDVLDWIPIRLAGLGYALVGDFHHGFTYWLKHVISGFDKNGEFTEQSGLIALHLNTENAEKANPDENKSALAMVDRTIILYLVVIALFVLGAWIY